MIIQVNKQLIKTILEDGAFSGAAPAVGTTGGIGGAVNASGSEAQISYGAKTNNFKNKKPKSVLNI